MECRDVEAILSDLHDGAPLSVEDRDAALAHCGRCGSCDAFRGALERLDAIPGPAAPAGMVERIVDGLDDAVEREAIAASAAIADAARPVSPLRPALEQPTWAPDWLDRKRLWTITGAVAGVAAMLSLVLMWGSGALSMLGGPSQQELARQPEAASAPAADSATLAATGAAGAAKAGPATAPDAIAFNGRVYLPGGALDSSASALTTIGAVSSAFSSDGAVRQAPVYRAPVADGSIVVGSPEGLVQCTPVQRSIGTTVYQLVTGAPLERYGLWARLPAGYPEPTSADGAPTFREAGVDSSKVPVYTPGGAPPTSGFAIAPGTPLDDPAQGNPNWTWWVPLVRP